MSNFDLAIPIILKNEGSALVADDHSRGSSRFGITLATYRETHPGATNADIAALGPESAALFYRKEFWERYHIGLIESQAIATKVMDLAVNMGGGTAVKLLQKSVGCAADGVIGPKTATAVNSKIDAEVLFDLRQAAKVHYEEIVQAHPEWAGLLPSWTARVDS